MSAFPSPLSPPPEPIIFVVDDDPQVLRSLQALLVAHRIPVKTFTSGEEFLAAFSPESCGCLITDFRMEGMTGLDLQMKVQAICRWLPVIVVTGHADVGIAVRILENGALTLIEKPYEARTLLESLRKAVRISQSRWTARQRLLSIQARMKLLTGDERAVMEMMVSGATNKAIAIHLCLAMRTVDRRRQSVLEKMEVATTAQLAALLTELEHLEAAEAGW